MPPKVKITKAMILNAVLKITQETGFESVNARSIANRLQCSTRPMFTCYENMEELKKDYTIVIVTHSMQQASRVSDYTAFFLLGEVVEFNKTSRIFQQPCDKRTEDYITGRFG